MTGSIVLRGARENNLRDLTLTIPRNRITVFTGVSGSGKSSVVFDTIAAEAQRQLNQTFTAFAQSRLPKYGQPDVDAIEGLSAPIIIDQKRLGGGSRSTVGTVTDINPLLRLLFSRGAEPSAGFAHVYSFNDPQGMCERCHGIGRVVEPDVEKFFDTSRSLNEGALLGPGLNVGSWAWGLYTQHGFFDNDKKLADYSDEEWNLLVHGGRHLKLETLSNGGTVTSTYEGVIERFRRLYINRDTSEHSDRTRATVDRFVTVAPCPECGATRYSHPVLDSRIDGYNIADLTGLQATELVDVLRTFAVRLPRLASLVEDARERVAALVDIGLGYLTLSRDTPSLSGGESQRIKMVRHLGSSLTEMLYVFDEPTIGLHARDVHRLCDLLAKLRDKGNTVLVVEHDRDLITAADHVVDMGPGPGVHGGRVLYEGDVAGLAAASTPTGVSLTERRPVKERHRSPTGKIVVTDARTHNLKGVTVDVPTGVMTVVTGVAGSGKSTLIHRELLRQHPDAVVVDQSAVATSRRSNPATYTGLLDGIRRLFARANGVSPSLFSFNSEGACPECQGQGVIYVELAFMDGLSSTCEVCGGHRFRHDVLQHRYRGLSISDVLDLSAEEAHEFFRDTKLAAGLAAMTDVGLAYLKLGQPLSTLSGGEAQRIKLATELQRSGRLYVVDEPTTGLHPSDIDRLLAVFDRLIGQDSTVIVIEHHLDVIKQADWVIDLGPGGGDQGGELLFVGTPKELLDSDRSVTAAALRDDLAADPMGTAAAAGSR